MDTETQLAFQGTKDQKQLAARAFEVMKRKGMLFAANAPIKMSTESIAKALTKEGGPLAGEDAAKVAKQLEAAFNANSEIFGRDPNGDVVTTKAGHPPAGHGNDAAHTFRNRLNTDAQTLDPEAAKEYASSLMSKAAGRAERAALMDTVVDLPPPPPAPVPQRSSFIGMPPGARGAEHTTLIPAHMIPQPPRVEEEEEEAEEVQPARRAPEPAAASAAAPPATPAPATPRPEGAPAPAAAGTAAPQVPARREEDAIAPARRGAVEQPQQPPARPAVPTTPAAAAAAAAPAPTKEPAPATPAPTPAPAAPAPAAAAGAAPATPAPTRTEQEAAAARPAPPKPAPAPAPAEPAVTGPVEVTIQTADGPVTVDLRESVEIILADDAVAEAVIGMIEAAVESDPRLIRFGSDVFPEEAVERFSKGDYRRIREYLEEPETGGVASDRDIMADVLNRRTEHPDYERLRFSVNYRMLREKKDFEFVGIDTDRLWIIANTTPVAPPTRKPAEIGQDYRFLEDPVIVEIEEEEEGEVGPGPLEYALTYYEYENGVLPYDRRFKSVFPGPLFEDQRSSLIRFEIPQLYAAVVGEVRYPTGNRGGFIMGLSELFLEHMVPGGRFTIVPTDRGENVFEIHFTRAPEREENLLQLDERKGRYVFRPVSFTIETDPAMLLTQEKFGKLHNQKKLEEGERKKPDIIITNAFEAVGDSVDGKLWAVFDDVYPVINIERPISRSWLRTLLSGAYPFFYPDETTPDAYFYDPARRPS